MNKGQFQKGFVPWNKGKKLPKFSGENHGRWKGDKASYSSLHQWLKRNLGSADHCEECGLDKIPEGKKRYFNWANISKKYLRELTDYKQLCIICHHKLDKIWQPKK